MSERTIVSMNDQMNLDFIEGMTNRMETALYSYGEYKANYLGRYNKEFLRDVKAALGGIVKKYKRDNPSTTANCNSVVAAIERLLLYLVGGDTRKGTVKAGNTEYLMDSANQLMIEFSFPQVPKAGFEAGDSSSSPGLVGHPEREAEVAAGQVYQRQGD